MFTSHGSEKRSATTRSCRIESGPCAGSAMYCRRRDRRFGRVNRMRLQRRLFAWFGVSIFMTGVVVSLVLVLLGPSHWSGWQRQVAAARHFVGGEFALVWDDPVRRDGLAARVETSFDVDVVLEDAARQPLRHSERACQHGDFSSAVEREGTLLGYVRICGRPGS